MTLSSPRRRADIRIERLPDGSAVLFDPETMMTYAVTHSAVMVWEACDGAHSPDAITLALTDAYDAPPDIITQDVDALLAHFHDLGLLEPDGETTP